MAIFTKTVAGRRELHFERLEQILADVKAMAAAPHRTLGNWSLGQICAHLAGFMERSLDGFEVGLSWPLRAVGRLMRRRFLRRPWPAGLRPPRAYARAVMPSAPVSTEDGLDRLRQAVGRLRHEPQRHPSPLLGPLTVEQWEQFHCRHAELHLSFVVPASSAEVDSPSSPSLAP